MKAENLALLVEYGEWYSSLYIGDAEKDLADFAPYLFVMPEGSPLEKHFNEHGIGKAWGIMAESNLPAEELKKHFRQFLKVKMESGDTMYFRFYDPRVLRIFLPTCNTEQLSTFFGRIRSFYTEEPNNPELIMHWWTEGGNLKSELQARSQVFDPQTATANASTSSSPAAATSVAGSSKPKHSGNSWID